MESQFEVPLPYLDLAPNDTYSQMLTSLEKLDEAAAGVFRGISERVQEDRGENLKTTYHSFIQNAKN